MSTVGRGVQPLACVVGDISLVRALGIRKIPVAVATSDETAKCVRSRYCREHFITLDWSSQPEQAVDALIAWGEKQPVRPVLFYQRDEDLIAISRARERLEPFFRFVLPRQQLVEDLVDKLRFHRLAEEHGFLVPRSLAVAEGAVPEEILSRWTEFPCVFKAAVRTGWYDDVSANQKALAIASAGELEQLLGALDLSVVRFLLQAPVAGREENVLSYHAYVRADGDIVGEFTGRKIRTAPMTYGHSTYLEITDDREVRELGRSVIERLDFTGVLKIDFKRSSDDGNLYMFEINPRFNLWHHPATVAGVAIPEAVYRDCTRTRGSRPLGPARAGVRWMSPLSDASAFAEHRAARGLTRARWLVELLRVDVNEGFRFRDPYPAIRDLLDLVVKRIRPTAATSEQPR